MQFGCKVTSCDEVTQGGNGDVDNSGDGYYELRMMRRRGGEAGAEGGGSEQGLGEEEQEEEVVVRARHVVAADGYFSRVRRTVSASSWCRGKLFHT